MGRSKKQYKQAVKERKENRKHEDKRAGRLSVLLDRRDFILSMTLLLLCSLGIIMLYSASSYVCSIKEEYNYDSLYLFKRQTVFLVAGIVAMLLVRRFISYNFIDRGIAVMAYVSMIVLAIALKTPLGHTVKGARRWIKLGGFTFQPAELYKIALIISLAVAIKYYYQYLSITLNLFIFWVIFIIPIGLLFFISNDLSSCAVMAGMVFMTTFVCSRNKKIHFLVMAAVVFIGLLLVMYALKSGGGGDNFRYNRVNAWLNPEAFIKYEGYQIMQGLYAIASGGLFGKGLGNSYQKLGPIPEAHNDMIFSIICEELGIVGAAVVIGLFIILIFHIIKISGDSRNIVGSVMTLNVALHIGLQAIINIAVNTNTIPNTGIALPFISYGGTALFCLLLEMGLVYAVERQNRIETARTIIRVSDENNLENYLE